MGLSYFPYQLLSAQCPAAFSPRLHGVLSAFCNIHHRVLPVSSARSMLFFGAALAGSRLGLGAPRLGLCAASMHFRRGIGTSSRLSPSHPPHGVGEASSQAHRVFGSYLGRLRRGLGASSELPPGFQSRRLFDERKIGMCGSLDWRCVPNYVYTRKFWSLWSSLLPKSRRVPTFALRCTYVKRLTFNTRIFAI